MAKKLPKTGNIVGRFMRTSGQVEREINRPSRGLRRTGTKISKPASGTRKGGPGSARSEHKNRVARARGTTGRPGIYR